MNYTIASALDIWTRVNLLKTLFNMGSLSRSQYIYQLGRLHTEAILGRSYGRGEL
jgi:hypothetical protein